MIGKIMGCRRNFLFLLVLLAGLTTGIYSDALAGDVAQVNLVLDEGVVLIYKGADYGFHTGDRLDVLRDGGPIGSLEVTDVYPTFTRARILSQDKSIQIFDVVAIAAPGAAPAKVEKPCPPEKKEVKKPEPKKEKPKPEPKKEEKKAEVKKEEKKPEPKKEEPKPDYGKGGSALPYTAINLGYFYLNQDFDTAAIDQPPVISYGIDYWGPMKKNHRMMYSGAYARPKIRFATTGAPVNMTTRLWYVSANYIVDAPGKEKNSTGNFYYGAGVAYRRFSMDLGTAGITGIPSSETSQTGFDAHGIVGYRFNSRLEFKGMYSFDEDYYSLNVGYAIN